MKPKLGRKPRAFRPFVPHLSAYMRRKLPPIPETQDYTAKLPQLGMLLNDKLGDCTCAAVYHSYDVWEANCANVVAVQYGDDQVLALYEQACGYKPSDPTTDQGGVEQDVLTYLCRNGAPLKNGSHRLTAFLEVDTRNVEDVKRTIYDCGVAYIGFMVPGYVMDMTAPGSVWDIQHHNEHIEGGHAVILAGYDKTGAKVISWGAVYTMTWRFFEKYCDEAYALVDTDWVSSTGKTPAGMTLQELQDAMLAIKQ